MIVIGNKYLTGCPNSDNSDKFSSDVMIKFF